MFLRLTSIKKISRAWLLAIALGGMVSCGTPISDKPFADEDPNARAGENKPATNPEDSYSYWDDDDDPSAGRLRVTIDLSEQTAYFFRGDKKVGRSRVASGKPGHSTPRGSFSIIEKTVDKRSNLYGVMVDADGVIVNHDADARRHKAPAGGHFEGAPMPYWMRLTNYGIGMHHGPIPNPGSSASHGCVRMPQRMAEALFNKAPLGTPVKVVD